MIVTGVDPGSTVTAITSLSATFDRVLVLRFLETREVKNEALAEAVRDVGGDIVGIERPKGIAYSAKGGGIVANLLDAAHAAGQAAAAARLAGKQLREFPAVEWRRWVVGNASATDAIIGACIPRLVAGWPKRSNNHQRDAAGAAIYAARTVALPILRKAVA